jgi:hypothetical protein
MLTAPAYAEILGVTLFVDDSLFFKFYPMAPEPSIRLDEDGHPIFLLVKYAFSDEERERDPSLPPGGGYCAFDVVYEVDPELLERVRAELQPLVDAQWRRLRDGTPEEQARPGVAGTSVPPAVEFGSPTWTDGTVKLDAPQAAGLVSARVAEGESSLVAGNNVVFNLSLSPAGADFMEQVLLNPGGDGGTDLVPLQVAYGLKFWARLPPAGIHIRADSHKVHEYLRKRVEGRGYHWCTSYDFDQTEIEQDTVTLSSAIEVQIDTGSGSLPPEVIQELRAYSLELVKQMIASKFFSDSPAPAPADPSATQDGSRWYLKEEYDSATMSLELDLTQRSVVEWQLHPQATLQTSFAGMSAEELKRYVRTIRVGDQFFEIFELTARVFTDFQSGVISNVEVEVCYKGRDDDGVERVKETTLTFTEDDAPQTWRVGRIGGERQYKYRYRVGFKGREPGPFSDWTTSTSETLNLAVPSPGLVAVDVQANDVDFADLVDQVEVRLAYEDSGLGVDREEHVVVLTPTHQQDRYQRLIYQPRRKPVLYRTRFKLKSGEVREDDQWRTATGNQILIDQDLDEVLRVNLLPAGNGWDDVIQVMVDLRYENEERHYSVQDTLVFKSRDEFKTWRVFLHDPAVRGFAYRWTAAFKNGHLEQTAWKQAGDDAQTVPVELTRPGFKVAIVADALDFTTCPLTEVTFYYASDGMAEQETFAFHDKAPQAWYVDTPKGAPVDFTYQITHHPAGSDSVTLPKTRETDTVVVLSPYRPPRPSRLSVQLVGSLIDFAVTPIVAVDLAYDSEPDGIHESGSSTLTSAKTLDVWNVDVKQTSSRQFRHRLVYYTADGKAHPTEWTTETVPRVIVPRYLAS